MKYITFEHNGLKKTISKSLIQAVVVDSSIYHEDLFGLYVHYFGENKTLELSMSIEEANMLHDFIVKNLNEELGL